MVQRERERERERERRLGGTVRKSKQQYRSLPRCRDNALEKIIVINKEAKKTLQEARFKAYD